MKPAVRSKTIDIISALFILLFVYTATTKLMAHNSFVVVLKESPLTGLAGLFLSWAIPLAELSVSALLFIPRLRRQGLIASFGLMAIFTIYIAYMLITSSHLPCSCGGIINKLTRQQHFWLNIFLVMLAATGIILNKRLKFLLQ
jgi:hypothetical protein